MLSMRFRHRSVGKSRTQDDLMDLISDGRLVRCFSATQFFSSVQEFSIGLRSGVLPGYSNNLIFFVLRKSVTIFARWHGAPSCINISQLCTAMCNSNFSFINSWYFLPFMVVPGSRKNRRPFLGLKSLPKSSHSAGVSWFAVWIFHCSEYLVVSSQFFSSRQTAELFFRRKTKLWTTAGLSRLCIFSQTASASTSLQGVSVF